MWDTLYITGILEPLSQWHSIEAASKERKLLVHTGNTPPHTAKLSTQYRLSGIFCFGKRLGCFVLLFFNFF
jgi:hypothetical protein